MKKIILVVGLAIFMFMSCGTVQVPKKQEFSHSWTDTNNNTYAASYIDDSENKSVDLKVTYKDKIYSCQFFYTAENPDVMGITIDISQVDKTGAIGFKYKNASGLCGIYNAEKPKVEEMPIKDDAKEIKVEALKVEKVETEVPVEAKVEKVETEVPVEAKVE